MCAETASGNAQSLGLSDKCSEGLDQQQIGGVIRQFRLVDAVAASNVPAFDHSALARALSVAVAQSIDANNLPIHNVELCLAEATPVATTESVRFTAFEQCWRYVLCRAELCKAHHY